MACKMTNTGNAQMPFLWNVSQRVGGDPSCVNLPTDVELVKFLMNLAVRSWTPYGNVGPKITLNSTFDAVVGYWIFRHQLSTKNNPHTIDGIVSPARNGLYYGPNAAWVIATLNVFAMREDKATWAGLPNNPQISASLRRELSTATS